MRILIIGLGSMGKRRMRNLQALGHQDIAGFDLRADRREEASGRHVAPVFGDFEAAVREHRPEALIISVPPDVHHLYMAKAIQLGLPFFVEASVVDTNMESIIRESRARNVFAAPSSTLMFHPAIKEIFQWVRSGNLGAISGCTYHSGQYLPDWHAYEKVSDYYVSQKETGGAREIVPFEMTWMVRLFGYPKRIAAQVKKTIEIEGAAGIDDTYCALLDYEAFTFFLTVDVVSRHATRRLVINGSKRQLIWDWNEQCVKVFDPDRGEWDVSKYEALGAANGYNKNITEQMYIDEMNCFLDSIQHPATYVNTLEDDHKVLKLLYAMEESSRRQIFVPVNL